MRLVYCERSSHQVLLLWNGGCVNFLYISEVNGVFFLEPRQFWNKNVTTGLYRLPSDTLKDMRMVNIETLKKK